MKIFKLILKYVIFAIGCYFLANLIGYLMYGEFDFEKPILEILMWFVFVILLEKVLPKVIHKLTGQKEVP